MAPRARLVETRPDGVGRARGIVSSRRSGRRAAAQTYAPPAELADVVAMLWTGRWDLRGQAPHTTERVPDPCANLAFEVGDLPPDLPAVRLVGPWTTLWRRTLAGAGHVRGVKLRAGALRAFVARPAHTLADRIVPLDALFGDTARLARTMLDANDDAAAFATVCDWLVAHRAPALDGEIATAIRVAELATTDPRITSVDDLAGRAGLGARALQRLFREHVGVTPKRVIRTARLQEVAVRIEQGAGTRNLARLAAELGYTDQAHLARDFKAVTGRSPSAFARTLRE
jgi:AraC-like DNA-binding protein